MRVGGISKSLGQKFCGYGGLMATGINGDD